MNTARVLVSRRPWWWAERGRLAVAVAATALAAVLGVVAVLALDGLAAGLAGEGLFGLALAGLLVTGGLLRGARRGRADDDVVAPTPGVPTLLDGVGAGPSGPTSDPIATVTQGSTPLGALFARGSLLDRAGDPDATVVARVGDRRLFLEQRQGSPEDGDGGADGDDGDGGHVPDLVLRLADDEGRAHAGAHAHRRGAQEDWTVPDGDHVLRFRSCTGRRPRRRTLVDLARGTAHPMRRWTRSRHRYVRFDAPPDLSPAAAVLCVWLGHLLDVRARLPHETWAAPSPEWTLVPDDFPVSIGVGGFGDMRRNVSSGGGGAPGGG